MCESQPLQKLMLAYFLSELQNELQNHENSFAT